MRRMHTIIVALLATMLLTSCAVGRKMSFTNENVTPDYRTARPMAIAFQDNRKEVLNGEEKVTWTGHMNSSAQIGYNMQTESGKAVADEFGASVSGSLAKLGIKAEQVLLPLRTSRDSALMLFNGTDKERLLLFHINRWEALSTPRFSSIRYEVFYDFDLQVFDRQGTLLASSEVHDSVREEEGQVGNLKHLQRMADEVFTSKMKQLLNDPKVRGVLE